MKLQKIFAGDWPVTQFYGANPQIYSKFGVAGHNGVDFGTPNGTILSAPFDGVVKRFEDFPQGRGAKAGYGVNVEIYGEGEWSGFYAILAHGVVGGFLALEGARVRAGDQVLVSDDTGFSTGPHVHFGLRRLNPETWTDPLRGWIDPLPPITKPVDPIKGTLDHLYDQKQLVEWAWQRLWDVAHLQEVGFDRLPAPLREAFEETRTKVETMRGNS